MPSPMAATASAMAPRATRWQIWLMNPEQYFFLGEECLAMDWVPRPGPSVLCSPSTGVRHLSCRTATAQTPAQGAEHRELASPACACPCPPALVPIPSLCLFVSPVCHHSHLSPPSSRLPFADPPCRSPPSPPFPRPITFFPSLLITSGQLHRVPAGPGPAAAAAPRSH